MNTLLTKSDLNFELYKVATKLKGATPTDIGYLINLFGIGNEVSLIFFNMYTFCFVELFLINLGRINNSSSIAGNLIITFSSELIEYFWVKSGPTYNLS